MGLTRRRFLETSIGTSAGINASRLLQAAAGSASPAEAGVAAPVDKYLVPAPTGETAERRVGEPGTKSGSISFMASKILLFGASREQGYVIVTQDSDFSDLSTQGSSRNASALRMHECVFDIGRRCQIHRCRTGLRFRMRHARFAEGHRCPPQAGCEWISSPISICR